MADARSAARTEWVTMRAKELLAAGFAPADARAQAEREFDVSDSIDFRTRALARGELTRNERGELVDRRGRRVFDGAQNDRRQRLDPDVREADGEGDLNAITDATLQREVHVAARGSHGSGRRRHKKPPKPDAIEAARVHETECSITARPALVAGRVSARVHAAVTGRRIGVSAGEIVEEFTRACVDAGLSQAQVRAALSDFARFVRRERCEIGAEAS